jgi:F0F1-type ATP synthase delta subunit
MSAIIRRVALRAGAVSARSAVRCMSTGADEAMSNADITKYFTQLDSSAPPAAKVEAPTALSKLTGRSGEIARDLYSKGKNFDKIVKDLESFVREVEKAGLVVDRFFTTHNYSEVECKKVVDLILTTKEPLTSFAGIKEADVREVIVDNESNLAAFQNVRKAVAALALSPEVVAAINTCAKEANLARIKLVAKKTVEIKATMTKTLDVVVSSAVTLSKAQQDAIVKALPNYVTSGQQLSPSFVVDPAVMGGLLVSFKNTSIDLTASSRLVEVLSTQKMQ